MNADSTRTRNTNSRLQSRPLTAALAAGCLLVGLTACDAPRKETSFHGEQQFMAVYQMGSLHTTVPPDVPVHSVIAAAEMALERRGYTITSTDATDDQGHVIARPNDGRSITKVRVSARLVDDGTGITVRTYPGGNDHASRDILERIFTRLGL